MFELSMCAILALILVVLFPPLLLGALYMAGFALASLIGGGMTFYLAIWMGVISQNAFWIAAIIGFLTGAVALQNVSRRRGGRRITRRVALR